MATCSFIKERKQTAGSMGRVIQYVSQPKKTMDEEGNRYLTGVNCVADVAMQSFMATKHLYGKDTGTFFYQYTQSFSPEEDLTPAQAHQIGLKLAEQFFPPSHAPFYAIFSALLEKICRNVLPLLLFPAVQGKIRIRIEIKE